MKTQSNTAGLIRVGDFGFGKNDQSGIYCRPEDRAAVQVAYDAIDEDNLRDDTLDDVRAAGGIYIEEPEL